ncbi:hypothetical protein BJF83_21445 [Nocardiopsis sp. CNR-923]|uniref:hypothetical protein n=1 Tax=Nocardiopsis sp. CNR-923 TaxID=1904965 RepID=UPI0009628052|nr:hypothetical protein [Nocardiopsis sp. CNR-923]OLT26368.1 hypothetical protein BJF83_21445 [Nocardiopsis sp. CNR-923]
MNRAGSPVGPFRYPTADDPRPRFDPRPTEGDVARWDGQPVRVTLVAGDFDDGCRIFDTVLVQPVPMNGGQFLLSVTQLLIPRTEFGFTVMASQYAGMYFGNELIDIGPDTTRYPVRRTYTSTEMYRYAGHGARMTFVRARPGEPIEHGTVYHQVQIAMDSATSDLVRVFRVLASRTGADGRREATRVCELAPVPLAEIAFAMQVVE